MLARRLVFLLPWLLGACISDPAQEPPVASPAFDDGFLWGTASASWQAEGDFDPDPSDEFPVRSNWTVWAERGCVRDGQTNERGSGFYTGYASDFALAASLGNNAVRLGIDWARIEPADDDWNEAEVQHIVDVLQAAIAAGLRPMLTLHHWVVPTWIQDPTGDEGQIDALSEPAGPDNRFVTEFEEFVRHIIPAVAPYVDLYPILNETFSVISLGYLSGPCGSDAFPPGGFLDIDRARTVHANYLFAHAAACRALRELDTTDSDEDGQAALCGAAASTNVVRPMDPDDADDVTAAARIDWIYNHAFHVALIDGDLDLDFDGAFTTTADSGGLPMDEGNYPELAGTIDWIGLNYYGPVRVAGTGGGALGGIPYVDVQDYQPSLPHSTLGFAIDPGGFTEIIGAFQQRYGLPMYVTENGIGDEEDDDRPMFLVEHVAAVQAGIAAGADIRGYFHWSLTDNFEWAHGFEQRFGLARVDYDDPLLSRTTGVSAQAYADLIEAGGVTDAIRARYVLDRYPSDGRP
jgi:beta-galactosidase